MYSFIYFKNNYYVYYILGFVLGLKIYMVCVFIECNLVGEIDFKKIVRKMYKQKKVSIVKERNIVL